ncbi:ABC-type uncharacterized transport system ATPase subunit [Bradyrhizobium sp. LA2.1]
MTQLTVVISNCNSVDRAEISVLKGTLNIKYGPNGLGKTIQRPRRSHATDGN